MNIEDLKQTLKSGKSYLIEELEKYGYSTANVKYNKSKCVFCEGDNLSVTKKDGNYIYKCFNCNSGGDIIKLVQEKEGIGFVEAVEKLAIKHNLINNVDKCVYNKLESCIDYILNNYDQVKALLNDGYNYEGYHVYTNENRENKFLKLKFRNKDNKKKFPQFALVDKGNYYKAMSPSKLEQELSCSDKQLDYYIYNYHNVKKAISRNEEVYFVEGEKDANTLIALGFTATTTSETNNFDKTYIKQQLKGARLRVICDNDKHGESVLFNLSNAIKDECEEFKVVLLPGIDSLDGGDVTDWFNLGNTKNDFKNCVKDSKLWNYKESPFWVDYTRKVDKEGNITVKPKKTLNNFKRVLDRENIRLKINCINRKMEIDANFAVNVSEDISTHLFSIFHNYELKFTINEINKYMWTVANENKYNPFKLFLEGLPVWDEKSRLEDFYNIFTTSESYDKNLKELLLKKWMLQFMGTAYEDEFKTAGMLIFRGAQGKGKTTVMKYLLPFTESQGQEKWIYMDEQTYKSDSETELLITGYQLVELSEFAKSLKDVDNLKRFLTKTFDAKRLIYQQNTTNFKRHTIFYGTVNNSEFLQDDENRRFWVIDLVDIKLDEAKRFDFIQLWAEIKYIYFNVYNQYWLDEVEMKMLDESNAEYRYKGELDTLIERKFDFHNPIRMYLTSSEVVDLMNDKNYSSTKVTQTLAKMKVEQKSKSTKILPRSKYNIMPLLREWGGAIPAEWMCRLTEESNIETMKQQEDVVDYEKEYKELIKNFEIIAKENEELRKLVEKLTNENKNLRKDCIVNMTRYCGDSNVI